MRAIVWTKYGSPDGLELQDIEKPTPCDHEVLIRVHAATVTAGDCEARSLAFPFWLSIPMRLYIGLRKPTRIHVLGNELAGEIEAVGKNVTRFKVGDAVFGSTGFRMGTYAEYVCMPEESEDSVLAIKPDNITYAEAAAITTGGMESLHFLRVGNLQRGEKILINGAGGSIGTFGVQLAKHYGAEVTAVDSGGKLDMLRELGADHVIDYRQEDFTKNGETYDVIFDVIGKSPYSGSIKSLKENGRYLIANPKLPKILRGIWTSRMSSKKVIAVLAKRETDDLVFLRDLMAEGKLKTVIDREYPLEQTAEAHRYVETGQKTGNLIISVVAS